MIKNFTGERRDEFREAMCVCAYQLTAIAKYAHAYMRQSDPLQVVHETNCRWIYCENIQKAVSLRDS